MWLDSRVKAPLPCLYTRGPPRTPGGTQWQPASASIPLASHSSRSAKRPTSTPRPADRRACTSARARSCPAACPRPTRCAIRTRSSSSAAPARRSGTSTDPSTATSTTASARWCRATPIPRSSRAVTERMPLGTHFAAVTEDSVVVAEELVRALGPAQVALHELRLRVDDGRDPARARPHRPRARGQDGGLLPRPPRHRDGLDRDRHRRRRRRPGRPPEQRPVRRRHPRLHRRADDPGAVQRRRRARRAPGRALGPGRLRDHGAGHDEHRRRAPAGRLPGRGARDHAEAQRPADLRRGQDGHHDRRRRRGRALRRHARHRHARQGARPAACRAARSAAARRSWPRSRTAPSTRSAPTTAIR